MPAAKPLSPEWWVSRLYKKLVVQQQQIAYFDDYYRGAHPLPWLAPQAQEDFRRILKMSRANYMGLVVDAQVERCNLEGFRVGDAAEGDKDTWRIWQQNNLDTGFDQALLESAIGGMSYTLTAPNPKDEANPFVWVEHGSQAIVEYLPGSNRRERAAGLKLWTDDWTGMLCATLQLSPQAVDPTIRDGRAWIFKFQSRTAQTVKTEDTSINGAQTSAWSPTWTPRVVTREEWPAVNPLAVVSLVEIPNNPRMLGGGVSELTDLTDVQDRVNKTIADRLMTQDFGAFPQKWSTGWPDEDGDGKPNPKIQVGRDRMVTSDIAETKFGQWDAAPLDPYSGAKREDVKDIASRSRTPAQYLLGELSNVNGETLKSAESGLVSKVRQRMRGYGDGAEETARLFRRAAGLPDVGDADMEAIWRTPEYRTEGELTDSLIKMKTIQVPFQVLWEKWGASPQEITRWLALNEQNANDPQLQATLAAIEAFDPGAVGNARN